MNSSELQYEVLRELDNLIELAVNKGFAIGIGQKRYWSFNYGNI